MPEKSGFFDSTADDLRTYPARDFAEYFARFITNGVFNGGTNLEVRATGNDANVRLSPGYAWISGYVYSVYDQPLVLGIQPAGTQDRIDRIVLRLDTSTPVRAIRAIILQGAPNANPAPPDLVRVGSIYDLSLAQVRVKANSTIVEVANVTDERLNEAVCGLVNSLIRVDTATFQRQWDEFIASVQNQGFATPQYVVEKANAAETNAKNESLPRTGGRLVGNGRILGLVGTDHVYQEYFPEGEAAGRRAYVGFAGANDHIFAFENQYADGDFEFRSALFGTVSIFGLKTSVANGKNGIAAAISDKGIPASGSDEFAVLENKIRQIPWNRVASGSGSMSKPDNASRDVVISGLLFVPQVVIFGRASSTDESMDTSAAMFDANGVRQPFWPFHGAGTGTKTEVKSRHANGFTANIGGSSVSETPRTYNYFWWACEFAN